MQICISAEQRQLPAGFLSGLTHGHTPGPKAKRPVMQRPGVVHPEMLPSVMGSRPGYCSTDCFLGGRHLQIHKTTEGGLEGRGPYFPQGETAEERVTH